MAKINGEEVNVNGATITEILAKDGYSPERVAVMLNGEILPKTDYSTTKIAENDEVDIVGFVGGG